MKPGIKAKIDTVRGLIEIIDTCKSRITRMEADIASKQDAVNTLKSTKHEAQKELDAILKEDVRSAGSYTTL